MSVELHLGDCLDVMREMDAESLDSIVCDPPYGLSFMGKNWDHGIPGAAFWAEALRVARPGAHLLAFGGTRTFHRLAVAIEDAGWELRDTIMWVYGSGFPKSLDVSKAIDKLDAVDAQQNRRFRFTEWVRSQGVTAKQIDKATGTMMGNHYTTHSTQPAIMTREHLEACRSLFREVPEWVEREADIRSVESKNFAEREVLQVRRAKDRRGDGTVVGLGHCGHADITAPATDAAREWHGWGTALKPAWEPIILARKPLEGTVARNVLKHGCGALNIDGCRVEPTGESRQRTGEPSSDRRYTESGSVNIAATPGVRGGDPSGRFPANLIHDGSPEVVALFPVTKGAQGAVGPQFGNKASVNAYGEWGPRQQMEPRGDTGSAARFFYCAKASKADRDEGLDGFDERKVKTKSGGGKPNDGREAASDGGIRRNVHPTVKPTSLMRYLVRLVTPPKGVCADIFMGSGSTGKAAMLEGFNFVGIEREPEYFEIAKARITAAQRQQTLDLDAA